MHFISPFQIQIHWLLIFFSPRNHYFLLAHLVLHPKNMAWLSACLGRVLSVTTFGNDSRHYKDSIFYTLFKDISLVHEVA